VRDSNHNHVVLEVALTIEKHAIPFKLNPKWMKVEDFVGKIKVVWKPYNCNLQEYAQIQFHQNLKEAKKGGFQLGKGQKDER
jgi:hypothetical protein